MASIYVAIRVRPFVPREKKAKEESCLECGSTDIKLVNKATGNVQSFALDEIWDSSCDPTSSSFASQATCYVNMGKKRLLTEVRDGFNCSLFAYGQTGSGKTTSIMGEMNPPEERGILPRVLHDLFDFWGQKRKEGWTIDVRVRMMEIYNERINDLLRPHAHDTPGKAQKKLDVRMHPKLGVYVPDLTINAVETVEDCVHLLEYGVTMKTVAATQMNAQSSRGHTIFAMKVEKDVKEGFTERHETNELFIVDLAGRENERTTLATGERLVELSFINKSLFHLANCIHALGAATEAAAAKAEKKAAPSGAHAKVAQTQRDISQANFRNSKLTLLLSEALSGNSKTYMIGTLSPAVSAFEENQVTLRFAATVKNIKLKASKIEGSKTDQVAALDAEVKRLRDQLANAPKVAGRVDEFAVRDLKEQLDATHAALAEKNKSWQDARSEAEAHAEQRNKMLKKLGLEKMKYQQQLAKMREQFIQPVPYISNESSDPHMTGRIVYSFAKGGSFFLGSDVDVLEKYAQQMSLNASGGRRHHGSIKDVDDDDDDGMGSTKCIQVRGLGISPKLARFDAEIIETARPSKKDATSEEKKGKEAEIDNLLESLEGDDQAAKRKVKLTLTRISGEGVVMLNNEALPVGEPHECKQGDKVVLGRAHIFRCYVDEAEGDKKLHERGTNGCQTPRQRRSQYNTSESIEKCIKDLLGEDSATDQTKVYLAKVYLASLKNLSIDQEPRVYRFLYEAKKTKHLVDEANEITHAVRPQDNLRFELDTMAPALFTGYPSANYMPQLLIRVIRLLTPAQKRWHNIRDRIHFAKGALLQASHLQEYDELHAHATDREEDEHEVLFVWSITKFLGRLDMMRDIYHNWMSGVSFFVDLKEDPWVEAGPVEMEFWLREKEEEKMKDIQKFTDLLNLTRKEARSLKNDKEALETKMQKMEKAVAVANKQQLELKKLENQQGTMSEMQLVQLNAQKKAEIDVLTQENEKLRRENEDLKKTGAGDDGTSGKGEKKVKELKQQFIDEKYKMLDRFTAEKEALKEELEKRLNEFKKKFEVERKNVLRDAENDKIALKHAFEQEKTNMRKQFKDDLEAIRKVEQDEMQSRYEQHEQQISMLNELLAEAMAKGGNAANGDDVRGSVKHKTSTGGRPASSVGARREGSAIPPAAAKKPSNRV
ncbi:unnamed protein product [Amoebophrya sp. A25]|nr:unnamed protein product [Amoebophrya sp. A25]|eukprot:GSA25T00002791001.1